MFIILTSIMPAIGLSANSLNDPGTVEGQKKTPFYKIFYKEHTISSIDMVAYSDTDGTDYSYRDIFEGI